MLHVVTKKVLNHYQVLGGSTAMNAMYLIRPSEVEINAWAGLMVKEDKNAAKAWEWKTFYEYMKKSETFTPPQSTLAIPFKWSNKTHGSSGPMQVSYPSMCVWVFSYITRWLISSYSMMSQVGDWTPTLENIGIPALEEPNGGVTLGALVAPSWINPSNWTRSYSKVAYLDPVIERRNLAIRVNTTVTRIIFSDGSGDITATGVELAGSASDPRQTVSVKKEIILAAGVVGSPQVLMLSGIGPADVLQAVNISVKVNLPGVGQHLQDHLVCLFHLLRSF